MSKIFGGDGYREVAANEAATKKTKSNFLLNKRKESEKKLMEQLKKEAKFRKQSSRASKLIVPKSAGKS